MKVPITLIFVFCLLLTSCGNRVIYYGRTYPRTINPSLYFREADISEPFEEMGKATMEVSVKRKSEKIQAKFIKKAEKKGADALLFDDVTLVNMGSTTGGAAGGLAMSRGLFGIFGSKTRLSKGQLVKVSVIKYKKNIQ
jgi:hypothetical protein